MGSRLLRYAAHPCALHVHREALDDQEVLYRGHHLGRHFPLLRRYDRLFRAHDHGRGAAHPRQPEARFHRHVPQVLPGGHLRSAARSHHRRVHLHGGFSAARRL